MTVGNPLPTPWPNSKLNIDVIPAELTGRSQWVLWRAELHGDKLTKVPYSARNGRRASSTNPETWTDFASALASLETSKWHGVGVVFSANDPLAGVDLDHCRDPETGEIDVGAREIIEGLASYTEVSPSGTGVKIFLKGKLPAGGRRQDDPRQPFRIEMYDSGRYFTVTGQHLEGTPTTVEDRTEELADLHARLFAKPDTQPKQVATPSVPPDDAELIERARRAANGAKFSALWRGDWSAYPSQNEADLALCGYLAYWTGGDKERIDSLFRQSGLHRAKWDERHYSDGRSYGEETINKALSGGPASRNGTGPSSSEPAEPHHLTDLGNAKRLVAQRGLDIRYCHPWRRWLVWDGQRWTADETGAVERNAKDAVVSIYAEAATAKDADPRKALADHARRSEAEARIDAMIGLAESEPGVPLRPSKLDRDPWSLNVLNGTVDLRSGELREHQREDLITKLAPVQYDRSASCPTFLAFLDRIMNGNARLIAFLQRVIGYSLTGLTSEEVLLILWGEGDNGKTTLLELLLDMMGDYAAATPPETFVARREGTIPNDLARLKGIRLVKAVETEKGRRMAEARVKQMTGRDTISARFMRGEWFDFKPEFTPWLATNHKPEVRGTDKAIWDRIRLVPFTVIIPDEEQDKALGDKLRTELPGVLAWAVEGCLEWQRLGLGTPPEVISATETYRSEQDTTASFIEDACVVGDDKKATAKALHAAYRQWCKDNGEGAIGKVPFGAELARRGYRPTRTGQERWWRGIGLVTQPGLAQI